MSHTYDLHAALGYQLTITARQVERRFEAELQALGLTRITWCVALAVGGEGLSQPSQIADFVGIDRTATSRALRQMQAAGLVTRGRGKADGRTRPVALTPAGMARLERANAIAERARNATESRLTPAEAEQLRTLLSKLRAEDEHPLTRL